MTRRYVLEGTYVPEDFECIDCRKHHGAGLAIRVMSEALVCFMCSYDVQVEAIKSAEAQGVNPRNVPVDDFCDDFCGELT